MSTDTGNGPKLPELIQVSAIVISDAGNDRKVFSKPELERLAASIKKYGLLSPISVRPLPEGGFELEAGERRLRAVRLLGWETVPAAVRSDDDEAASDAMFEENFNRVDLDPIAAGEALQKRKNRFGYSDEELAERFSLKLDWVQGRLSLLALRADIQHLVSIGELPLGHARDMTPLDSNRQGLAIKAFQESPRQPTRAEFRSICGELLLQQEQDVLFDPDAFFQIQVAPDEGGDAERITVPVDPRLPQMKGAATLTDTLVRYLRELQESPDEYHREAAAVVGTVMAGLARSNYCGRRLRREVAA